MRINIYSIAKIDTKYQVIEDELCVQCRQFGAEVKVFDMFPKAVQKAHKLSPEQAQSSYTQTFKALLLPQALNFALHPNGKVFNSHSFAKCIESTSLVQFFIGGAYGFEEGFLKHCQSVSVSAFTLSHKIAKLVLCEQIYRALSILHAHPYHK